MSISHGGRSLLLQLKDESPTHFFLVSKHTAGNKCVNVVYKSLLHHHDT